MNSPADSLNDDEDLDQFTADDLDGLEIDAFLTDDPETCLEICRTALTIDPECDWAWLKMGDTFKESGDLPKALDAYSSVTRYSATNARAYSTVGHIYADELGDPQKAHGFYLDAYKIEPQNPLYSHFISANLVSLGDHSGAASYFEKAIDLTDDPETKFAYRIQLAGLYSISKDHRSAMAMCNSLLETAPDSPEVLHLTGECHDAMGDTDKAIPFFKKAISIDPENPRYHLSLFYAYMELEDSTQGLFEINEVIRLDPQNAAAFRDLGSLCLILEDFPAAKRALDQSLILDPNDGTTHYHLHCYFTETNDHRLAQAHLDRANELGHVCEAADTATPRSMDSGKQIMGEKVITHNETHNITITDKKIIVGNDVTMISDVESSFMFPAFQNSCRDAFVGMACIFGAILCFASFSIWGLVIGLLLLVSKPIPLLLRYLKERNKFIWLVKLRNGEFMENHDTNGARPLYSRFEAAAFTISTEQARLSFEEMNDPRRDLDLS